MKIPAHSVCKMHLPRCWDVYLCQKLELSTQDVSWGKVVVIVVVSFVVILRVAAFIAIGVWKNKEFQKKRKGANDAEKLVKVLHDINLNFKYSTLEKATGSFDEANKLGQGGFIMVYKVFCQMGEKSLSKGYFSTTNTELQIFIMRLT